MIAAVKREAPIEELRQLMPDAGATIEEVNGLLSLRRRAQQKRQEAEQFVAAKKNAERHNKEWDALGVALDTAATLGEQDRIEQKLAALEAPRREANYQRDVTKLAAETLRYAQEIGVI